MATLLWQRDLSTDVDNVKNTYSSWDSCMSKEYCKWPAIIGIIIGCLVVLSVLWCLFRCLCCGAECCCGILSCCNSCCPSPRRRRNDGYYEQPPPQPPAFQPYPQYHSPAPPAYASGGAGYRGAPAPQTAALDAPGHTGSMPAAAKYNEDALPAMPSWDHAANRRVAEEDVEMHKLDYPQAQQEALLPKVNGGTYYGGQESAAGDLGGMHSSPYHDYEQHQQYVTSPTATTRNSAYPPTYHTRPASSVYEPEGQQWGGGYAPSVPPSYHTGPPSIASPPPQSPAVGRRPVQGTWRDI